MPLTRVEVYAKWMFLPDDSIVSWLEYIVFPCPSEYALGPSYTFRDDRSLRLNAIISKMTTLSSGTLILQLQFLGLCIKVFVDG